MHWPSHFSLLPFFVEGGSPVERCLNVLCHRLAQWQSTITAFILPCAPCYCSSLSGLSQCDNCAQCDTYLCAVSQGKAKVKWDFFFSLRPRVQAVCIQFPSMHATFCLLEIKVVNTGRPRRNEALFPHTSVFTRPFIVQRDIQCYLCPVVMCFLQLVETCLA